MLLTKIISKIQHKFSNSIIETTKFAEEDIIHIKGLSNLDILKLFKDNGFNFLADITAIDAIKSKITSFVVPIIAEESVEPSGSLNAAIIPGVFAAT